MKTITGYVTHSDGTETLAWELGPDGIVACDHAAPDCCQACVDADSRLMRTAGGVRVASLPDTARIEGRTVTYVRN